MKLKRCSTRSGGASPRSCSWNRRSDASPAWKRSLSCAGLMKPSERLADESARAGCALVAVVDRAREIEGVLRAGHGDIGETAFLGDMTLAVRRLRPGEGVRETKGVQAGLAREALVRRVDQEHHTELEALRLVDAENVHLLARGLEVRGHRIVPRLPEELEVRDRSEER